MALSIRGLAEVLGADSADCLAARTAALDQFEGCGPPDLCRLTKCARRTSWPGAAPVLAAPGASELRLFHYVLGLNVADASSAADYIQDLVALQEQPRWTGWLFAGETWDISLGIYCCYDAFSRVDVRVEVRGHGARGAPFAYGVDERGAEVRLSREIWEGAQLSALLRSLPPPPRLLPGLRALPLFAREGAADALVRLAMKFLERGERLEASAADCAAGAQHLLCDLFCRFLVGSRRLGLALEVLSSLQSGCPEAALHVARAYRKRGQPEAALHVLVRALRETPNEAPLLHYQAKVLLGEARADASGASELAAGLAASAAELAAKLMPGVWRFWVTLARAYLGSGRFAECLAVLNAPALCGCDQQDEEPPDLGAPATPVGGPLLTVPQHGASARHGLVALRPAGFELLPPQRGAPQFGGFGRGFGQLGAIDDASGAAMAAVGGDGAPPPAAAAAASAVLAPAGPGAVPDAEREAVAAHEACSDGRLSPMERGAYSVLVGLYRRLGWDGLLAQRSKVFLMQDGADDDPSGSDSDPESPRSAAAYSESIAPTEALSSASARPGRARRRLRRRIGSRRLDRLFEMLRADLTLFSAWRREQEGARVPAKGSGLLWMHRGAQAERLQHPAQAELAFRHCQARCACPRASLRLLKLYAAHGRVVEAVAQLSVLCGLASPEAGADDPRPWAPSGGWPDWLFEAAAALICRFGLSAMHAAAGRLPEACLGFRFALAELLRAAQGARVDGCDR